MHVVGIGEVENALFEILYLVVHLVRLDMRLKLREIVDGALAVSCSNHIRGVLANVFGDFPPGCLNGCNRVCEGTVLQHTGRVRFGMPTKENTHHIEQDSVGIECLNIRRHDFV